jgi:hypothetical protein
VGIPTPTKSGNLLRFDRLDTSGYAIRVYTVGWRIVDQSGDQWTKRFLNFKSDTSKGFMGGAFLLREAVREILVTEGLDAKTTGLAIALSSGATKISDQSVLYRAGYWIAAQLGLPFIADSFTKKVHRSLHSLTSSSARDSEVSDKYSCTRIDGVKTIIIVDDFVTRGATFNDMRRALQDTNPGIRVIGLALGKNEKASYAAKFGYGVHNDHISTAINALWVESAKRGEQ